jgi:hypothetical protein
MVASQKFNPNLFSRKAAMKAMFTAVLAGMFLVCLQGPMQAQQEVEPPAIPPMLEDRPPLVQPEPKPSHNPAQVREQKPKTPAKTTQARASTKKVEGRSNLKRKKNQQKTVIGVKTRNKPAKKTGVSATPKERQAPNNT